MWSILIWFCVRFFLHLSLYTNLVFMTTLYYLLLRYTLTLTLFISSLSWLLFELWSFFVSIDLLANYHVCFTLFSRDPFFRGLEGCYGLYRTFQISNLIPRPRLKFFANNFSKKIKSPFRGFILTCFPL